MGLADCDWGDVIVLVGGNELRRFEYEFRPVIYADIEARVEAFWQSIRKGKAPRPEYSRDGDVIAEIYSNATDDVKDLRADNRAVMMAAEYLSAKQMEKQSAAEADAIKAEFMELIGDEIGRAKV